MAIASALQAVQPIFENLFSNVVENPILERNFVI